MHYMMLNQIQHLLLIVHVTHLELKGVKPNLSTMSAKNQVIKSSRVDELVVRGYNNASKVSLLVAFTRSAIPVNRSHISNPEMAQQWPHLKHIANELMPVSEYEVGLLIGYNCPKALVPREVIPHVHNSPYA